MDASLSRSSIPERRDPHDWNTWDHYQTIHEQRLDQHPFIDHSKENTFVFEFVEDEGVLHLEGRVFCHRNVILEVEKWFELRYFGNALRVRGIYYVYVAWVEHGNPVLKYHNIHRNDEDYHHRIYDPLNGDQVFYEKLERYQFPVLSEVLDEVEIVTRVLEPSEES